MSVIVMPSWFLLSYDATKELYELKTGKKLGKEDFRKHIIRILLQKNLKEMDEYVESTILFYDHDKTTTVDEKLDYWGNEFDEIGKDFTFILVPVRSYDGFLPMMHCRQNETLNENFQKLVEAVRNEKLSSKK